MNSNRCPKCGGIARHLITDVKGNRYYQCETGLTTFRKEGGELVRAGWITPCDTVIDQLGRVFSGIIAFVTGNKVDTLVVTDGKIK